MDLQAYLMYIYMKDYLRGKKRGNDPTEEELEFFKELSVALITEYNKLIEQGYYEGF